MNKQIIFVYLALLFISSVAAESINTLNCNSVKTEISKEFGTHSSDIKGENDSFYNFSIAFSELKQMNIFYERIVNGFEFLFLNGSIQSYGFTKSNKTNTKNDVLSIDLENKEIKSVKINHGYWINTLQFEIYDLNSKTTSWSEKMPGQSYFATESILSSDLVSSQVFRINSIHGIIDTSDDRYGDFLQSFHFEYSYCPINNLIQVEYSYSLKDRATKTSKKTTQLTRITTTSTATRLPLFKYLVEQRLSDLYGYSLVNGHRKYGRKFFINLATLKKIKIYHGRIVNGFKFFYKNGDQKSFGFTSQKKTNDERNEMISIDLENKEIVSVRVNHGYWVNTLQFEIYDHLTEETKWSKMMPGQSYFATDTTLDASQFVMDKKSFKINTLIGEIDESDELFGDFLQSLQFEYSVCLNDLKPKTISIATTSHSTKENTLKSSTSIILDISTPIPEEMRKDAESINTKINLEAATLDVTIGLVKTEKADQIVFMSTVTETTKSTTSKETIGNIKSNVEANYFKYA